MNDLAHDDFDQTPTIDVDGAISELLDLIAQFKSAPLFQKGHVGEALGQHAANCLKITMSQTAQQQREIVHLRDRQAVLRSQVESLTDLTGECIQKLTELEGKANG